MQYRAEYLFWDVLETVRKLYLVHSVPIRVCVCVCVQLVRVSCVVAFFNQVTVVAFFAAGSMIQVVLSILISVLAFAYHVHAMPYAALWLNGTRCHTVCVRAGFG